ncbi:MAG: hypothetical protein U9O18_05785, partial [Chloroflexota bacterium]|nr:hypothetical protein [Chloroflexota bacterium]
SGGVRLASGKGVAVVVYSFPVAKYKIYGWMSMDVLGRSPNRHKAVSALWNKSLGSARDLGNYDAVKAIGPGYRWWKLGTQGQGRVKDGKARGMVMTWKGLGRSGPAIFDIKKVRLTYKVGILHEPVGIATVDSGSEFEQELLARAPDGPVGERITDLAPLEELPELHLASELPVADGVSAPASTLYYQTGPDAPVWKGRTLYTTSDESVFSGWAVETPTEDMRFVISSDVVAGQTYTDGMVKVRDRGPVIGYCGTNESAFTVNDIARDADGTTTMLSLTARWTCLDYITEEPTGSFFAELRYNTAEPAHGGLVPEVAPDWWEPSVWQYDRLQLRSAAIGSRSDNTLLFTAIGTKPTTIGQATISGYRASNFAVVNDTCSNTTLLVGETCSVDLRLQPSARGYREAVVTIPLDTVIGEREFEVYGYGQHATTTTISLPKGPHTETFSVRTQLQPLPDDPTGGNRCMALRREGPYGHLTVEAWCDLDGVSSFTEESLKVGRWTFQATSAETKGFASSTSALAATRVVKEIRDWGTSFVDRKTFYPYPDGYRDTVAAYGNRKFPMAVAITVTSVASGEVVAEHTIPAAATKYRWEWDGMIGGALAPAGAYDIETTLTENKWTEQTFTKQVAVSRRWVQWRTKSVTLPGKAFALSGKSKDAYISKTRSRWSSGVRIGSGKGAAMVVYALPVAKAQAYGSMTFSVLGRSPNRHKAVGAVWNPKLGGYRNGGNYDAAVEFGPGYKWWKTTAGADGRVRNGKIRAAVMVWKGLGRTGPAVFDIRKVKLTYKVGSLQPVNTAPPLSLAWSLATDQDGLATGRMVRWMPGSGRLPLASDVAIPPDLTPYETLDEDGAMTDEAVETDPLEEPAVSPAPEATEVPEEPEPTPEPTSEPTVAPKSTPEPTPTPTPSATPTPAPEVPAEPTPELTPVNLAPSADAGGPYKVD